MKTFLLFILTTFLCSPAFASEQGTILLHKISETDTEVTYALEAREIKPELIGISTTLLLPEELTFKNYQAGTFFEEEADEVTYLIAPKSNNDRDLVIGIVTLGESSALGNGPIVTLIFSKLFSEISRTPQIIEAKASGVVAGKRVDYDEILWQTENTLPMTGPFSMIYIFILSAFTAFLAFFYKVSFTTSFTKRQG